MNDEQEGLSRVYRRAGIGLGIAALAWTGVLLAGGRLEDNNVRWLIPIGAAALSVYCLSLHARAKKGGG